MKKVEIRKNDAGQRLDKFLTKYFKALPQSMIYKWLRKKKIRLNGKHPKNDVFLICGDILEIYVNDEFFPPEKKTLPPIYLVQDIDIVYEDKNILVCDKPSGVTAHDGKNSLVSMITSYLYQKGDFDPLSENTFSPALCHRIDRNTSGLVIAAKNAEALRFFNEKIRQKEIRKFYFLITDPLPQKKAGTIKGYIKKDNTENKVIFSETPIDGGRLAITKYKVTQNGIEAELLTGRTHQLRASFAHIGCPILGDVKYGAKKNGKSDYQELRAIRLIFNFNDDGNFKYLNGKTIEIK